MAPYIDELIQMHKKGKIKLRLGAISASEKLPKGNKFANFEEFEERINRVGLSKLELLKPIGYWDITFHDWCVYSGEKLAKLEKEIQEIIHPNYEVNFNDHCKKYGYEQTDLKILAKWLNAKCDVLAMWCHIWYNGDIFVSSDGHFFGKKKDPLLKLGSGDILRPDESVTLLTNKLP